MGTRQYTKEDCTVWSYDGDTSLLGKLGDGTVAVSATDITNDALLDEWEDGSDGKKSCTVDAELACESDDIDWYARVGGTGTLTITTDSDSITGTFRVVSAAKKHGDAMRWNVSLKSKGVVTIS